MNQPQPDGPATPAKHTAQEWASYYRAVSGAFEQLDKLRSAFGHEIEMWGDGVLDNPDAVELIDAIVKVRYAVGQLEVELCRLGASDVNWLKKTLEFYELRAADVETIARWAAEQSRRGMLAEKRRRAPLS